MAQDLTKGNTNKVLLKFTIPLFISILFQQFYNIADSLIVGRFAGEDALAAVGASYPITNIFNAVAIGCNIGCSVVISQLFGGRKYKEVRSAASTALISCLALGGVMTALGIALTPALMKAIDTPENIFLNSALYLEIYVGSFVFLFIYNISNGIFTSLGDSKTPLYFLIFSSVLNVMLDYVFVRTFANGVSAVAWATFIAQGLAGILSVTTLLRHLKKLPSYEGKAELFSFELLGDIAKISIPSVLQQSFVSVGNIFIQKLINGFGSSVIAGFSAAIKLNTFTLNALCAFGNAVSGFTAQNYGAGKYHRIKEGMRYGCVMVAVTGTVFAVLYLLMNETLIKMFMEGDGSKLAIESGTAFLKTVSPFFCFIGVKLVGDGILRGVGSMKLFMTATFTDLILRVILAFVFAPVWGYQGIWYSWPIGWTTATVLSVIFFFSVYRKLIKKAI